MQALTQHCQNGWTFSLAPDTSGLGYSCIAYPTDCKDLTEPGVKFFKFESGLDEERVFNFESAMKLYKRVRAGKPPAANTPKEGTSRE